MQALRQTRSHGVENLCQRLRVVHEDGLLGGRDHAVLVSRLGISVCQQRESGQRVADQA